MGMPAVIAFPAKGCEFDGGVTGKSAPIQVAASSLAVRNHGNGVADHCE